MDGPVRPRAAALLSASDDGTAQTGSGQTLQSVAHRAESQTAHTQSGGAGTGEVSGHASVAEEN